MLKLKVKFSLHAMKVQRGIVGIVPFIGTRWRWVVSLMSQLLYAWGKTPLPTPSQTNPPDYSLNRKLSSS